LQPPERAPKWFPERTPNWRHAWASINWFECAYCEDQQALGSYHRQQWGGHLFPGVRLHRHHPIAHCNQSTAPQPISPPLPIAAAAVHHNHATAVHHDHRCHPSCVVSHCAASALVAIVCHPLCRTSCRRHPIAQRDRFAISPPIAPPLPIAAATVHCDLAAAIHCNRRCSPSHVATQCAASAFILASASIGVGNSVAMPTRWWLVGEALAEQQWQAVVVGRESGLGSGGHATALSGRQRYNACTAALLGWEGGGRRAAVLVRQRRGLSGGKG
jgi:hypothetical protein